MYKIGSSVILRDYRQSINIRKIPRPIGKIAATTGGFFQIIGWAYIRLIYILSYRDLEFAVILSKEVGGTPSPAAAAAALSGPMKTKRRAFERKVGRRKK